MALLWASTAASAASISYAPKENRISLRGGAVVTLSAIKAAIPEAPLDRVDAGKKIWLLRAHLSIENGTVLRLHGSSIGGDVNELRLMSNNRPVSRNFVSITAEHGRIDIRDTHVQSWDLDAGAPDEEFGRYGRAFIRVRSKLIRDGTRAIESRMDIVNSEIGYLGYGAPESYGLVWKVSGSQSYVFRRVQVRGDVVNSRIHHNYFGLYSYGGQASVWRDNEVYHNVEHGMNLQTHSDQLLIIGNSVRHNGGHGLNISCGCEGFEVRDNRFWSNGKSGFWLQGGASSGLVQANRAYRNTDSGIAIHATEGVVLRSNVLRENGRAGLLLGLDASHTRVEHNDIGNNGSYGIYLAEADHRHPRGDAPVRPSVFRSNQVYGSGFDAVRMVKGAAVRFIENNLYGNAVPVVFALATDRTPPPKLQALDFLAD